MITLRETEKAYLAGIIDGEGSISIGITKRIRKGVVYRNHYLRLQVTNTDSALIQWLNKLGGSTAERKLRADYPTARVVYSWNKQCRQAGEVLEQVYPYLITKRKQAEAGLFFQSKRKRRGNIKKTNIEVELDERLKAYISKGI